MAALRVTFHDAAGAPLADRLNVTATNVRTNAGACRVACVDGSQACEIAGLTAGDPYRVHAFPERHRAVGQFVLAPRGDTPADINLYFPVDPDQVREARFPSFASLSGALRAVLDRSTLERDPSAPPAGPGDGGESVYVRLTRLERAGLLNLFCKMTHTDVDGTDAWSYVTSLFGVRGDRIFGNVAPELWQHVRASVTRGAFKEVDGALHTPPPGFTAAGSFKSREPYGNLQLTFFRAAGPDGGRYTVDADIDDAAGLRHVFQVLDHWIARGSTHPFDIREILTRYQRLIPDYDLVV